MVALGAFGWAGSVHAQPAGRALQARIEVGLYAPAASSGTFGVATAKERASGLVGGSLHYWLGHGRRVGVHASADWAWKVDHPVEPTPQCTGRCSTAAFEGGQRLVAIAGVVAGFEGRGGRFELSGGVGVKRYKNDEIGFDVCDGDPLCRDLRFFAGSATRPAVMLGAAWSPGKSSRMGVRLADIVSRHKAGRVQHDFLALVTFRFL